MAGPKLEFIQCLEILSVAESVKAVPAQILVDILREGGGTADLQILAIERQLVENGAGMYAIFERSVIKHPATPSKQ